MAQNIPVDKDKIPFFTR